MNTGKQASYLLITALCLGLAAPAATAQARLFVGSPSGVLYSADPLVGAFAPEVDSGEPIGSLARLGDRLVLGAPSGTIRAFGLNSGLLEVLGSVPNDATDIAVWGTDLLISGSDGTVLRFDPQSGTVEDTYTSGFAVQALAVDGDTLYTGTPFGVFQTLDLTGASGFEFAGLCGGPINSMALTDAHLYLGDQTGQVYVFNKTTKFVTYAYPVDSNANSIVRDGDTFLIGGDNGKIERVMQIFGSVLDTFFAPEPVFDMLLVEPTGELVQDVTSLSLAAGGTATLGLSVANGIAGDTYIAIGSASGTSPGVTYDGVHLDLNVDGYFKHTLLAGLQGVGPLFHSFGSFDSAGHAQVQFVLPTGIDPALAGTQLHHAFVTFNLSDPTGLIGGSNSVALALVP